MEGPNYRIIQNTSMSYENDSSRSKRQAPRRNEQNSSLKQTLFALICEHLNENPSMSPIPYYILHAIESLSLLWFLIQPALKLYPAQAQLYPQLTTLLRIINFHEFLTDNPEYYIPMTTAALSYLLLQLALLLASCLSILRKKDNQIFKYLRKIVNLQLIFTVKALSGPLLALAANVLYCNPLSPYHTGMTCYQPTHLVFCMLAALVLLVVAAQIVLYSTLYCMRNPFSGNPLGEQSRYYMLSKSVIKLFCPLYFAVRATLPLDFMYVLAAPGLWGIYIFFHRLASLHSYNHQHFYVEYLMEGALFWVAVSGALSYYIEGIPNPEPLSVVYTLISALLMGYVLVSVQRKLHNKFMQQCLQGKIKKQNLQKFMLSLIDCFLHSRIQQGKITYKVYSRIIYHNNQTHKSLPPVLPDDETNWVRQVHRFLLEQVEQSLKQTNSVILKTMKCYLLSYLGYKNASLHQSYELQNQRLSLIDEFSVHYFRSSTHCSYELPYRNSPEYVKLFRYQEESTVMEELMEDCGQNNAQYWDELCESDPSLPKLRNLATLYIQLTQKIAQQYEKVVNILPDNPTPTGNYLLFLKHVSVDVRQAIRVREKLRGQLENRKGAQRLLGGTIREEEISMVAIDTIGSNIGIILNCNLQIKELLGFEKKNIIGKQVTKLMPKIYAELHNSFILRYIKSNPQKTAENQDNTQKKMDGKEVGDQPEKIVTALNTQLLMVEVGLSLQVITTADSSLVVAGFLVRKQRGREGLVMVQGFTGEILGVDLNFMKLMKQKISGKQVTQQQIRLSSLLPEVKLDEIQKQGYQITLLQIGHLSDQQEMQNLNIKVRVELKQIKIYLDHKIVFLSIFDEAAEQHQQTQPSISKELLPVISEHNHHLARLLNEKVGSTGQLDPADQLSLECSDNAPLDSKQGNSLNEQLPLARKLEQFIQNKSGVQFNRYSKICYLMIALSLTIYLSVSYSVHYAYLSSARTLYSQMQVIADIPYQQAQVNLNINKIWSTSALNFRSPASAQFFPPLTLAVTTLADSLAQVVQATQLYPYPLEYNQANTYMVNLPKAVDLKIIQYNISMTYLQALDNYISCTRTFLVTRFFPSVTRQFAIIFTQQAKYVTNNGDQLLPSVATSALQQFQAYFSQITESQIANNMIVKAGLMIIGVVCMACGLLLGRFLNKTHREVLAFYRTLRLWDINELGFKCNQYLKGRGKNFRKDRKSSILKIFPVQTLIDIIQQQKIKQHEEKSRFFTSEKHQLQSIIVAADKPEKENLSEKEEDDSLLRKESTVRIEWQQDHERAFMAVAVILIAAAVLLAVSMYFLYSDLKLLQSSFLLLQDISIVRKNLALLNLYSYKLTQASDDSNYHLLLSQQIRTFYSYSTLTHSQLSDPIFKTVYSQIQILQSYFASPSSLYSPATLSALYLTISSVFQRAMDAITDLDQRIFKADFNSIADSNQQKEIIMTVLFAAVGLLGLVLVHFCYIRPIHTQRNHTINMLKILPAWILNRTPEALGCVTIILNHHPLSHQISDQRYQITASLKNRVGHSQKIKYTFPEMEEQYNQFNHLQPIYSPVLQPSNKQTVQSRQFKLKELVDRFSQHHTSKICKKIKYRGDIFQVGDYVLVRTHTHKPYICRIAGLFAFDPHIEGIPIVQLQWCLQKTDLMSAQLDAQFISEYQIFPSNRRVCQYLTSVLKKCIVFTLQEYLQLQSYNIGYYFTRAEFDTIGHDFIPPMPEWQKVCSCNRIPCPKQKGNDYLFCKMCNKWFHRSCAKEGKTDGFRCLLCEGNGRLQEKQTEGRDCQNRKSQMNSGIQSEIKEVNHR